MPVTTTAVASDRAPNMTAENGKGAAAGAAALPAVRTRAVLIYVAIALALLVPGLMNRLEIGFGGSLLDVPLQALKSGLDDIRFGSGVRFWLGVSGASMMGLLLLYPLRKLLSRKMQLGSVGGWFHVHMIMGLGGPVAVLYHANFGHGGTNANVALWSMLTVAVSGILGYFIYGRASAEFYSEKQRAREQLEAITAILEKFEAMPPAKRQLIAEMEAFEAELLTPRQGVVASVAARLRMEQRRLRFARAINWLMGKYARETSVTPAEHHRLRAALYSHLQAFMRVARHASSRSIREQIWARWRLFHLPVFLVMVIAVVLHVRAVWDTGGSADRRGAATQVAARLQPATTAVPKNAGAQKTETAAPKKEQRTATAASADKPKMVPPVERRPTPPSRQVLGDLTQPGPNVRGERTIEDLLAESAPRSGPAVARSADAAAPSLPSVRGIATIPVTPYGEKQSVDKLGNTDRPLSAETKPAPQPRKGESTAPPPRRLDSPPPPPMISAPLTPAPAPRAAPEPEPSEPKPLTAPRHEPRSSTPLSDVGVPAPTPARRPPTTVQAGNAPEAATPTTTPAAPASGAPNAALPSSALLPIAPPQPADMKPVYAELQRKTEEPPMALGGGKRSLDEQIATLKAKMAAKQFFHSEAETGFLLSAKHMKLECTACHTKPLKEVRSTDPRQCIDCHKKDDVHKGRQPDCASCHTTNRWSQILKRK